MSSTLGTCNSQDSHPCLLLPLDPNLSFSPSYFSPFSCTKNPQHNAMFLLNLLNLLSSLAKLENLEPADQIRENPGPELAVHDHPGAASERPLEVARSSFNGGREEVQSMRKEKDWSRTLECKLLEERNNGGGERMDLLWEAYERREEDRGEENQKKTRILDFLREFDEDDDDDEGVEDVQPCCLKALSLGMRKPGLLKAFKGVGIGLVLNNHRKKGF